MSKPPPLPAEVLARVLRISGIDGYTLIFIAGGFGLVSASCHDWPGALTGAFATVAGFMELHGRRRIKAGETAGFAWLVRSQLALLAVILTYIAHQLHSFDVQSLLTTIERSLATAQRTLDVDKTSLAQAYDLTPTQLKELATQIVRILYVCTALASILCQGGLALYYHKKRTTLAQVLRKN